MDPLPNLTTRKRPLSDPHRPIPLDLEPLLPGVMRNQVLRKPTPPKFHTKVTRCHKKTVNLEESLLNAFNNLSITKKIQKHKRSKPLQQRQIKQLFDKSINSFKKQVTQKSIRITPLLLPLPNQIRCQCVGTIITDSNGITDLILLKDGRLVYSTEDNSLKIYREGVQGYESILENQKDLMQGFIQISDGSLLSFSLEGDIKIWNISEKDAFKTLDAYNFKNTLFSCIELQGAELAFGCWNEIMLWNRISNQWSIIATTEPINGIYCCTQLNDGRLVVSAEKSHYLYIWDFQRKDWERCLKGHTDTVYTCIQLKDGRLVSASKDNTLKIWDADIGACLFTLKGHEEPVRCCIQLKNGYIVSASEDGTLKVWCSYTGVCLATLERHFDSVVACVQLENGLLASASLDGTIKTWLLEVEENYRDKLIKA